MARRKASSPELLPSGFAYKPEFLTVEEEAGLLRHIEQLGFHAFEFQGYTAKRRVVAYGYDYDFTSRDASVTEPIPEFLQPLKTRAAEWAGLAAEALVEAVVTEYTPGTPIGWHRDVPQFEVILGISLGNPCWFRFKPYRAEGAIVSAVLEPRSIYAMSGDARWKFQHSIPPVDGMRYSITFRTWRGRR